MAGEIAAAAPAPAHYDKWQAEDDLRTLTRAREIQKDATRMAHVRRAAKEKLAEMKAYEEYAKGDK